MGKAVHEVQEDETDEIGQIQEQIHKIMEHRKQVQQLMDKIVQIVLLEKKMEQKVKQN